MCDGCVQCDIFGHKIGRRESLSSHHEWCDQMFCGSFVGKNFGFLEGLVKSSCHIQMPFGRDQRGNMLIHFVHVVL